VRKIGCLRITPPVQPSSNPSFVLTTPHGAPHAIILSCAHVMCCRCRSINTCNGALFFYVMDGRCMLRNIQGFRRPAPQQNHCRDGKCLFRTADKFWCQLASDAPSSRRYNLRPRYQQEVDDCDMPCNATVLPSHRWTKIFRTNLPSERSCSAFRSTGAAYSQFLSATLPPFRYAGRVVSRRNPAKVAASMALQWMRAAYTYYFGGCRVLLRCHSHGCLELAPPHK